MSLSSFEPIEGAQLGRHAYLFEKSQKWTFDDHFVIYA
jgi:hypothetical protein